MAHNLFVDAIKPVLSRLFFECLCNIGRWKVKRAKLLIPAVAAVVLMYDDPGTAASFHNGTIGDCGGCHQMHSSSTGSTVENSVYQLQGSDASSTCLRCHGAATPIDHQMTTHPVPPDGIPPLALTPGGDFAYIQKNYSWIGSDGKPGYSAGDRHGHNIVSRDYGYRADSTLHFSPGGEFPGSVLSCTSCHDPHGRYRIVDLSGTVLADGAPIVSSGSYGAVPSPAGAVGSYRMLAGQGYQPPETTVSFVYNPPIAVVPVGYNRGEDAAEVRVAYGMRTSEWCGNCHGRILAGQDGTHLHPSNVELGRTADIYNSYVKSGELSGNKGQSYSSLVPFQVGESADITRLTGLTTSMAGPEASDKVACLTCHRAHASGWDGVIRWNGKGTFLTVNGDYPGIDASGPAGSGENSSGKTRAEYKKAMYDRSPTRFALFQRSLCNKCHARD